MADHAEACNAGAAVICESSYQAIISQYLRNLSTTYQELHDVRKRGWENPKGDEHFRKQRQRADNSSSKAKLMFFNLMKAIGDEMQSETSSIRLDIPAPRVLDLCMAPGGYTASALKFNPSARVSALTLPTDLGGHEVLIPHEAKDQRVKVAYCDIAMILHELDGSCPDSTHADAKESVASTSYSFDLLGNEFDLIFCDGQVLRTHERADWREACEASRLTLSQLILATRRVRPGGTLIMLLHKIEAWRTINLLYCFSRFARIQLFKPQKSHAQRSSFYMIAQGIDPRHPAATKAIEDWRESWHNINMDLKQFPPPSADEVRDLLAEFGAQLLELGEPIWHTQLDALKESRCGNNIRIPATNLVDQNLQQTERWVVPNLPQLIGSGRISAQINTNKRPNLIVINCLLQCLASVVHRIDTLSNVGTVQDNSDAERKRYRYNLLILVSTLPTKPDTAYDLSSSVLASAHCNMQGSELRMFCRLEPYFQHDPTSGDNRGHEDPPSTTRQECKSGHTVRNDHDAEKKLCRAFAHHLLEFHTARTHLQGNVELVYPCIDLRGSQKDGVGRNSANVIAYMVDLDWDRSDGRYEADATVKRQMR